MRNYVERAQDFIAEIFPYICECENVWDIRACVKKFNFTFDRKVIARNGLSRVALMTSDYVVKFDYDPEEVGCIGGCENEIEVFAIAKREGFASLFAEITPYSFNQRMFYIMPRIRGVGSGREYAENYMTEDEKAFCRRLRITDLHTENYGFRKGHVCLVDYACNLEYASSSDYECYYENRTRYSTI